MIAYVLGGTAFATQERARVTGVEEDQHFTSQGTYGVFDLSGGDARALEAGGVRGDGQEVVQAIGVVDPMSGEEEYGHIFAGSLAFQPFQTLEDVVTCSVGVCEEFCLDVLIQLALLAAHGLHEVRGVFGREFRAISERW